MHNYHQIDTHHLFDVEVVVLKSKRSFIASSDLLRSKSASQNAAYSSCAMLLIFIFNVDLMIL